VPPERKYPHVTSYPDRHGKRRWRVQKDGRKAELGTVFGGEVFESRYAAFIASEPKPAAPKYAAGTFGALITAYQSSREFKAYAPATKLMYRRTFQKILDLVAVQPCGDRWFQTHHAQMMIDMIKGPAARDTFRKKLGVLMRFAMRTGVRSTDPVAASRSGFESTDGIKPWTLEQVLAALSAHPMTTPTGLALRLMFETGAALADVVRLGPEHLADGVIVYKRQKLGKRSAPDAACPLSDELLAYLATIRTKTFLTHNGKPRSGAGLGNRVRAVAKGLGFEGSAHGIRKARANFLWSSGADLNAVAAVLGQSGTKMAAHYTLAASRVENAKTAVGKTNLFPQPHLT
jgi:integrase